MKVFFLSKRRPQGRDLYTRPYGRFFHLPWLLAEHGHEVHLLLLSYRRDPSATRRLDGLYLHTVPALPRGPGPYLAKADALCAEVGPDWVIGFSDTWYGILAQRLAEKHGCNSLIDAYDNYESYIPWCTPLHLAWRRAIKRATAVTAAGPQLANLMQAARPTGAVEVVPMAADPLFRPMDQVTARQTMNLPLTKKLIGYCGSIYRNRGMEFLFQLAERVTSRMPDVQFIFSGRRQKGIAIPSCIQYLGYIPDARMPTLLNSMDTLLVMINGKSAFGQYSYPAKLYEAMRCEIPVVASATEPARWILDNEEQFLGKPGDLDDFTDKVIRNTSLGRHQYRAQNSWENSADLFEKALHGD